jgi:hypothetical protein
VKFATKRGTQLNGASTTPKTKAKVKVKQKAKQKAKAKAKVAKENLAKAAEAKATSHLTTFQKTGACTLQQKKTTVQRKQIGI